MKNYIVHGNFFENGLAPSASYEYQKDFKYSDAKYSDKNVSASALGGGAIVDLRLFCITVQVT